MGSVTTCSYSGDSSGSSSICYGSGNQHISRKSSDLVSIPALRRPFENLISILESPDFNFPSDASIVVKENCEIPIHSCILSFRSPFFKNIFDSFGKSRGGKFKMKELAPDFDVGFDALVVVLDYLYSGKVSSLWEGNCVCVDDDCSHIGCRPAVIFKAEVLYASFIFQIPELVSLYQMHILDSLAEIAIEDILVILSVANICSEVCGRLLVKCIDILVKSDMDAATLDKELPYDIVKHIIDERGINCYPDRYVTRIHRALDMGDVHLVGMLLREGHTTLNDAYALHYAVAYCDAKTIIELLDLGLADVNLRNPRGYSVLHVAAMLKEPKIIASLLINGARPFDLTPDGRKALQILKRFIRFVDYNRSTGEGKVSPKDWLCIEILGNAEKRHVLSSDLMGDDLFMNLLYLESRVSLAKLLFPMEAKIAMATAEMDGVLEFRLSVNSQSLPAGPGTLMDLYDSPFQIFKGHLDRIKTLSNTVELGKLFFPRCWELLDKIVDADDLWRFCYLATDTVEKCAVKKRFMKLQDILSKASSKKKEELNRPVITYCLH